MRIYENIFVTINEILWKLKKDCDHKLEFVTINERSWLKIKGNDHIWEFINYKWKFVT